MKIALLVVLSLAFTACGKDDNNSFPNNENNGNNENNVDVDLGEFENNDPGYTSTNPVLQFGFDYYRAYCERLITCRDEPIVERFLSTRGMGSFEACLVTFVQGNHPQRWVQLEMQERTFSIPSRFDDCLEDVQALSCEGTVRVNPNLLYTIGTCGETFQGQKDDGNICETYLECPEGSFCTTDVFVCDGICDAAADPCSLCEDDEFCNGVACEARKAEGDACDYEGQCAVGSGCVDGSCVAWTRVEIGDACNVANYCPIGSICWNQTCSKLGKRGDSCSLDTPCDLHLSCNDGTCGETKKEGSCEFHFECQSRRCDPEGMCEAPEALCFNE